MSNTLSDVIVVPANLIITHIVRADSLRIHSTATPESIYNITERLIEELDAEAKHIRSLGLFG